MEYFLQMGRLVAYVRSASVAIGAERGVVPDRVIHRQPHKPAVQQVEIDLLHQLPFGTYRKQDL